MFKPFINQCPWLVNYLNLRQLNSRLSNHKIYMFFIILLLICSELCCPIYVIFNILADYNQHTIAI